MDEENLRSGQSRRSKNPLTRLQWGIAFGAVAIGAVTMIGAEYLDNGTVSAKTLAVVAVSVCIGFGIIDNQEPVTPRALHDRNALNL